MNQASSKRKRIIVIGSWQFKIWHLIVLAIILVIFIMTVTWWFNNFERIEKTSYSLTERANYNPYYAAELLLERTISQRDGVYDADDESQNIEDQHSGLYAHTLLDDNIKSLIDDLPYLDSVDIEQSGRRPVLIVNSIATKLTANRHEKLQNWVQQGGHLITFAGKGIDNEDFDEILESASTNTINDGDGVNNLNATDFTDPVINSSQAISELTQNDVGNQFLAQLGIVSVDNKQCEDCENSETSPEMQAALDEIEKRYGITVNSETGAIEAVGENNNNAKFLEQIINRLKSDKSLSIVRVPNYSSPDIYPAVENEVDDNALDSDSSDVKLDRFGQPLMIKNAGYNQYINTEIFSSMFDESVHSKYATTQAPFNNKSQRADDIRYYLKQELNRLELQSNVNSSTANNIEGNQSENSSSENSNAMADLNDEGRLSNIINFLIALDDQTLSELFAPQRSSYFDVLFGKGRLTVLTDRNMFVNPNPNMDLFDPDESTYVLTKSQKLTIKQWTPLKEVLGPEYVHNLYSVDNAKFLTELTRHASQVFILTNTDVEPLPAMLWKQAKYAILGLAFLLFVWLWSLYDRFGKQKLLSQTQSNNIIRYFNQIGRYGWNYDQGYTLLKQTRQQTRLLLLNQLHQLNTAKIDVKSLNNTSTTTLNVGSHEDDFKQADMNPIAGNLLANLNSKEIMALSQALIHQYHKKLKSNQDYALNSNDSNENPPLNDIDAEITLGDTRLTEALISPLSNSYKAHTFVEITETLWLVNWILS